MNGFLCVLKPPGMTSSDVVVRVRRKLGRGVKVGHAGTLDPEASGVLPLMIGRAARLFDYLVEKEKTYVAQLKPGYATDTQDAHGAIIAGEGAHATRAQLEAVLPRFIGEIAQIPPMYSALKRDGQKLCDLARQGIDVKVEPRPTQVYAIQVLHENADGSFTLQAGDNIYVTADSQDLAQLIKHLGIVKQKVRNAIIVGGSRIAYYLAMRCLHAGLGVKIIEQNHERCVELAELLPSAVIIEADGSRQDILAAEGISSTDAVITLTNMDEENLIISMYASHIGVPKVITKVNRTEYVEAFKSMGIDTFISPKALCSTDIVRYVRAMQNTTGGSVITLHRMVEGKAEALEFRASETTRHLGETLLDIQLKPEILIACITHKGRTIIPRGSDVFQAGDTVIVVTTSGQPINDLNDIFAD